VSKIADIMNHQTRIQTLFRNKIFPIQLRLNLQV